MTDMTSYSVVYSSKTGNTARLAERLREILPHSGLAYFGPPEKEAADAEVLFVGFWTDKGDCDETISAFLEHLRGRRVFLFGTAGFGGSADYFEAILSRVRAHLDESNTVIGAYMCQGRMPEAVRRRYEAMQAQEPEKVRGLLKNFDRALSHPDAGDLRRLEQAAESIC